MRQNNLLLYQNPKRIFLHRSAVASFLCCNKSTLYWLTFSSQYFVSTKMAIQLHALYVTIQKAVKFQKCLSAPFDSTRFYVSELENKRSICTQYGLLDLKWESRKFCLMNSSLIAGWVAFGNVDRLALQCAVFWGGFGKERLFSTKTWWDTSIQRLL